MTDAIAERSYCPLRDQDLVRLATIAANDLEDLISRRPNRAYLRDAVTCIALCQGGALHYIDEETGVKDLDVFTFYRKIEGKPEYPYRRHRRGGLDFGDAYFGRHPSCTHYVGRKVDVLGRSILVGSGEDPADALRRYLTRARPRSTPWFLAQKAVVLLWPPGRSGEMVWSTERVRSSHHAEVSSPSG
jgi:hypothetical protein